MPTDELRCSFDTRAKESTPSTPYGEERWLAVRNLTSNNEWSYVSFSGLPDLGSVVPNAYIRVWLKGANWSGGPHDLVVRRVVEKWKESQLTWSNVPDVDAGVSASVSVTNGVDGQSVDIPVTAILAGVMTGDLWYGFRLGTTTSVTTTQRQIYSSEAADPAMRPLLVVEYSTLPDAPVDLNPSGGKRVSIAKPTFGWQFRDPDGDEQGSFQVQIEDNATVQADGSFATPEYDSGWIPTNAEEFDSTLAGTGGALPTFVAAGTIASGTGDITPGLPAGWALNDILLVVAEAGAGDPALAAPTGYAHVTGSPVSATQTRLHVFWKRSTAVESAPLLVDTGNHQSARMIAVRGCRTTGNPWEITQTSSESVVDTTGSATGPTTTQANDFIVIAASSDYDPAADDTVGYSAWTNAALGSLTEQIDNRSTAGGGGTLGVATGTKATAGAVGATTYTLANAGNKAHLVIALAPTTSGGPTWAGISADATRWWIVRARDEMGNTSPWADVQSFIRTTKGTLAISSPTNGGTVEETTPPIITTLTGRAQEAISYLLEQFVTADSEWVEVWSQGRRAAPANSAAAYSFGVPSGKITAASTNYRLTVRSWDDQDRDATPGDPVYVQAQSTFTFARSATPSPVTVLTAAAEASSGPGVKLTFNRAVGQAAPDYFALVVDSVRVMDRIDPVNIIDGGSPIVFSMVWYGAEPYDAHTYEVEAVTFVSGVLKHSQGNDTEVFTAKPTGIWLLDDNDPPYRPASPPRRVRFTGTTSPSLGIAESGATYHAVGRRDPVTIIDAISGYEGTVVGRIRADDAAQSGGIATFRWMKRPRNVGRQLRLIAGGLSVPVELGVVDQFTPVDDAGQDTTGAIKAYDVSFAVTQVDEFGEVD
jgi:hypothetical protein